MKSQSKARTLLTISKKVAELKACITDNRQSLKNGMAIECMLDGILSGIKEDSTDIPKLKLIKQ